MVTQRQTLEQGRAKHAFDAATEAAKRSDKNDYKSYTKKVPMLIKTNGLGATLAFMQSKGKAYKTILENLESWFKESPKLSSIYNKLSGDCLVAKMLNCDTANYRALTTESLAYLNWLRRFAEGLIKEEK
jgi:CRISPR-associated protein Cmr5